MLGRLSGEAIHCRLHPQHAGATIWTADGIQPDRLHRNTLDHEPKPTEAAT